MPETETVFAVPTFLSAKLAAAELVLKTSPLTRSSLSVAAAAVLPS